MWFRKMRKSGLAGMAVLAMVMIAMHIACGSSPFLAANFNQTLADFLAQNPPSPPPPDNTNDNDDDEVLGSVCDLPAAQQFIQMELRNDSAQTVDYAITFVVSAGPGGFVCDDQIDEYLSAGYSDAILPGTGNSLSIGCDVISLLSGTRILTLEFGAAEGLAFRLEPDDTPGDFPQGGQASTRVLTRRDNNSNPTLIPLPELIVFGRNGPPFACTGDDLCSQRGFAYLTAGGIVTGKAPEARNIQGTVCAENAGTAPEWRLDRTLDNQTQQFQYGRGGAIIAIVLDRAADSPNDIRDQVVWQVTDADGNTLHFFGGG